MTSTRLASSGFSENKGLKPGLGHYWAAPFRGCPVINSVLRGRGDTRVWYRETIFSEWFYTIFPCTDPYTNTFCTSSPHPPPQKPRRRCEPEEGYLKNLRCSKQFDHRSHSIIFFLFEFKSVDDVGAGELREMLTLHTNPHAVHGRFTLKDDCERQAVERRGRSVNSKRGLSIDVVHEQLISTIYEQSISPVDDTMAEDLIVSCRSQ